jgi:hypothetical protein
MKTAKVQLGLYVTVVKKLYLPIRGMVDNLGRRFDGGAIS